MNANFSILRRETSGGYSTRGPIVTEMTLERARNEIERLRKRFPYQDFVIVGEIEETTHAVRATVGAEVAD